MRSSLLAAFAATASLALPVATLADGNGNEDHDPNGPRGHESHGSSVLRVALWGDEFYNSDPDTKAMMTAQTIKSMNSHDLDFTLFVGDTKNGSSLCTDDAIGYQPYEIFNSLHAPTLYSLGDNEWTDCHRSNNGSYDPLERLQFLRSFFFRSNQSQGVHPIEVERQGAPGGPYSENSRFVRKNVEFVALHIPGSNNNLVVTDSQCFKKSERTWPDCDLATAEYEARNVMDVAWLKDAFAEARQHHYVGVVIAIQADIFFPFELSDGGYQEDFLPQLDENNGYSDFFHTLVAETQSYNGQVLLVHGDSHYFKMDKAMFDEDGRLTANFTRVEVFGSEDNSWVLMTVDPAAENLFSFSPIFLE